MSRQWKIACRGLVQNRGRWHKLWNNLVSACTNSFSTIFVISPVEYISISNGLVISVGIQRIVPIFLLNKWFDSIVWKDRLVLFVSKPLKFNCLMLPEICRWTKCICLSISFKCCSWRSFYTTFTTLIYECFSWKWEHTFWLLTKDSSKQNAQIIIK